MQMTIVSLVFDIIVMGLLAATIFYAVRLSRHLDTFRSNRSSMEQLIRELSSQITRAQEGITVLDEIASTKGDELRKYISQAQGLSDELQIMIGSADSLATRLEGLATRNRAIVDDMEQTAVDLVYPGQSVSAPSAEMKAVRPASRYEDTLAKAEKKQDKPSGPFFHIRDPDFEEDDEGLKDDISDDGEEFMSQAERDLAEALKRRNRKS